MRPRGHGGFLEQGVPQLDFIVCLKYLPGMRSHMSLHFKDRVRTSYSQREDRDSEGMQKPQALPPHCLGLRN